MIADSELVMSTIDPVAVGVPTEQPAKRYRLGGALVFCLFLAIVVALQYLSGAYSTEFSGYPDEPAHYVTSLMLRDYILHFSFEPPLRFAQEYYRHYPKVAFGHWPPVFYVVQSFWMLLFSASRASVRLEMAFTTALLAYSVYLEARRWFGANAGVMAGVLTAALPLIQDYSDQEMSEALLTLCCFWSVVFFARYVEHERARDSWLFGAFAALAILTKGSGWLLVMVPPIVLVLTRRIRLLTRPAFWAPAVLVAITCVPWQLLTIHLAERGWDGGSSPSFAYTSNALIAFLSLFPKILGPLFVLFLVVGIIDVIVAPFFRANVASAAAAQFALLVSVWIFHSLVPAGVEDRKLVLAVPAMVLFVFAGARFVADLIPRGAGIYHQRYFLIGGLGTAAFLLTTFTIPKLPRYGFIEAARFLTSRSDLRNATILVSSESVGEGLLISEMAMKEPQPKETVIRGTKALATVSWNGLDYHSDYSSPEQILNLLRGQKVNLVVMDTYPMQNRFPHNDLLWRTIKQNPQFSLLAKFPSNNFGVPGEVDVYQLR